MDYDDLIKRKDAIERILALYEQADELIPAAVGTEARMKAWFALRMGLHGILLAEVSETLETWNTYTEVTRQAEGALRH